MRTLQGTTKVLIFLNVQRLRQVSVLPYFKGVPIEAEPVAVNGNGLYVSGQMMSNTFHSLNLENVDEIQKLEVGCTYSCAAHTEIGDIVRTHWLYCTSKTPQPSFGVIRNWAVQNTFAPLIPLSARTDDLVIKLEEVFDLVAVVPTPAVESRAAHIQLGRLGWLVMARVTAPHSIGFLIENPTFPPMFPEGASSIAVSATSRRTQQAIGLDGLTCVTAGEQTLLLKADQNAIY